MPVRVRVQRVDIEGERFTSPKCRGLLRIVRAPVLDYCIVAALNPAIHALAPADPVRFEFGGEVVVHRPDIAVLRDDGLVLVDVAPQARSKAYTNALGMAAQTQGLRYECRETAAHIGLILRSRMVWDCRFVEVGAGDQVRVLLLIDEAGGHAPLREVETAIRHCADRRAAVFSLACHNVVEFDLLVAPATDQTLVRRRRATP